MAKMERRRLGAGGPEAGALALGTMTFGVETPEDEARRQMDLFADAGGTMIDTADAYAAGLSEEIVGRWLRDRGGPADLTVATKGRFGTPSGASAAALTEACENSLRRLGLERIDLYLVHGWDGAVPVEETLGALGRLHGAGKIGAVGWSNVTGWQLQRILSSADAGAGPRPVAIQPQYNLLDRGIELELLPCALDADLGVTPWSPLGGGWLTGKYRADARPAGATRLGEDPARGVEAYDRRNTPRTHAVLDVLGLVAARLDRPMAQVAIAWLLGRPGVASVLLGARTAAQLKATLGAAGLTLDEADAAALTAASAPGLPPYPYGMLEDYAGMDVWKRLGTAG